MRKLNYVILTFLLLSFTQITAVYASRPDSSTVTDEQIIRLVSYDSIIGEAVISHHFYIGVEKGSVSDIEPLLTAFTDRLYGLETAFGKVTVRYEGTFDSIDLSDFTDIVLAWNGEPLEFKFLSARKIKYNYRHDFVTDIYLDITSEYEKPGVYSFTGKYRDTSYTLYIEVKPGRAENTPADPAALTHMSVTYLTADEKQPHPVTDISFHFSGIHQSLRMNDFRDVRLTNGGEDIPFSLHEYIIRHYNYGEDENDTQTVFTLVFENALTLPGTYRISGFYRDEPFNFKWTQQN